MPEEDQCNEMWNQKLKVPETPLEACNQNRTMNLKAFTRGRQYSLSFRVQTRNHERPV